MVCYVECCLILLRYLVIQLKQHNYDRKTACCSNIHRSDLKEAYIHMYAVLLSGGTGGLMVSLLKCSAYVCSTVFCIAGSSKTLLSTMCIK